MAKSSLPTPRPFLKWAGGKKQLIPQLLERLPDQFAQYHEPFVGGGAFFFALQRQGKIGRAFISDLNSELIDTYNAIRHAPEAIIHELKTYPYEKQFYYDLRQRHPATLSPAERAARMIYLNKTGFNGLYRVNRQGQFNVPFGRHKNQPNYVDEENLRAVSHALQATHIACHSFEQVAEVAQAGDFVYFDPPYVPISETARFTAYQANGFSLEQQTQLRDLCLTLHQRGAFIMLSNSDAPEVRERYAEAPFFIGEVQASRSINCHGHKRGKLTELIITNY